MADSLAPSLLVVKEGAAAVAPETTLLSVPGGHSSGWGYSFSGAVDEFKKSFYIAFLGIIMCCISFPCLYWNEGRCVTREMTLGKARDEAVEVGAVDDSHKPDSGNNTKLVHIHGAPHVTVTSQSDTQFGVTSAANTHAKRVKRTVKMWQWCTRSHTEQRDNGTTDSNGNRNYDTVTVIDDPELDWGPTPPTQPQIPTGSSSHQFQNDHPAGFSTADFKQGCVKLGPYNLTIGMVDSEMATVTEDLIADVAAIQDVVANGFQLPEAAPVVDETAKDDDETAKDGNEESGLLSQEGSGQGSGYGSSGPTSELSPTSKAYLQAHELYPNGSKLRTYQGSPSHHDYEISWQVMQLPASNGKVPTHTVLAGQKQSNGSYTLTSWIPEGVEEFRIDSCCQYICPCGYRFIEEEPLGYGCISKIDTAIFPNASNDAEQGDSELGGLLGNLSSSASNSRKVEKLVQGEQTIDQMIRMMEDLNAEKTVFYRKCGFVLMFFGFQCMMDPFPTFFHFIPLVGHAIGFIVYIAVVIAALALGCFGSITTISVAWLRYRPLWGILGIAVAGGLAYLIVNMKI